MRSDAALVGFGQQDSVVTGPLRGGRPDGQSHAIPGTPDDGRRPSTTEVEPTATQGPAADRPPAGAP